MLTISCSPSTAEIASVAYDWPSTTMPWVIATAVFASGRGGSSLHTHTGSSAMRVAGWMSSPRCAFVSAQCHLLEDGQWVEHRVVEVSIGYLGETPVAVFQDDRGNHFCPDAPDVPPSRLANLKVVCTVTPTAASHERVEATT